MVYAVGLTGGIGCGKSSAAKIFASLGAAVIDTDAIAHQLTAIGQPALESITSTFGYEYLQSDGNLDRARMRKLIFSDKAAKNKLENILHPLIKQQVANELGKCSAPYALIVVPLLMETQNYHNLIQRVLVVDCTEDQQITRTMARNHLSSEEVQAIMDTQVPRSKRLAIADDVITNTDNLESIRTQILRLHEIYLRAKQTD